MAFALHSFPALHPLGYVNYSAFSPGHFVLFTVKHLKGFKVAETDISKSLHAHKSRAHLHKVKYMRQL